MGIDPQHSEGVGAGNHGTLSVACAGFKADPCQLRILHSPAQDEYKGAFFPYNRLSSKIAREQKTMTIGDEELQRIGSLAQLDLPKDTQALRHDLDRILNFVEQLGQARTEGVEVLGDPLERTQRLRADEVTETNQREALQACAPAVEDGFYKVPRVVE